VCPKLNLRVINVKGAVIFGCLENTESNILLFVQNVKVHTGIDLEKQKVRNNKPRARLL
jgi:hypothetical protein